MGRWRSYTEAGRRLAGKHETKLRYLVVGGVNTVVGLSVFPVLYFLLPDLKQHYLILMTISQVVNVTFAFITQKSLVFRTVGNHLREYGKFAIFHLLVFAANLLALPALVEVGGLNPIWAQLSFALTVVASSYLWHSRITFRGSASCQ